MARARSRRFARSASGFQVGPEMGLLPAEIVDDQGFIRPVLHHPQGGGVLLTDAGSTGSGDEIGQREVRSVLGQRCRSPWEQFHDRPGGSSLPDHVRVRAPLVSVPGRIRPLHPRGRSGCSDSSGHSCP